MAITSPDEEFVACLQAQGTVVFLDTWYPQQNDLASYPHIEMTSRHHWNPHQIQFPQTKYGVQEEVEGRNVLTISMCFSGEVSGKPGDYKEYKECNQEEVVIHDMDDFNRRLISSIRVTEESALRINILEKKRKREVAAASQGFSGGVSGEPVISSIRVTEGSALRINILEMISTADLYPAYVSL